MSPGSPVHVAGDPSVAARRGRVSRRGRRAARNRDRAAARRDVATGVPGDGPGAVARRRRCHVEATGPRRAPERGFAVVLLSHHTASSRPRTP